MKLIIEVKIGMLITACKRSLTCMNLQGNRYG
jgi:hypothetical protein